MPMEATIPLKATTTKESSEASTTDNDRTNRNGKMAAAITLLATSKRKSSQADRKT
jgi:hypothetical protein